MTSRPELYPVALGNKRVKKNIRFELHETLKLVTSFDEVYNDWTSF